MFFSSFDSEKSKFTTIIKRWRKKIVVLSC